MRALILDDSRAMTDVMRDFLNRARFQVLAAATTPEALTLLDTIGPVDVALVSWDLPGEGARKFVREIRSRSSYDSMKVIMVTNGLDTQQVIQGVRAGVDECLIKPFTRNKLLEKIAALCPFPDVKPDSRA